MDIERNTSADKAASDLSHGRSRVRVLPRDIAEKIAAGEVIERPGSVVKELVENSIDAGATAIKVELDDGGKKRIVVSDNGDGIPYDDVLLALERHATSKISHLNDLWNLHTLGFRGEALPSICTISRFTLETRTAEKSLGKNTVKTHNGRRVYLEGGRLLKDSEQDALPAIPNGLSETSGTKITVEDLFFNVPARLKFQRSKNSENLLVRELLERVALARPEIGFTLVSDGRRSMYLAPPSDRDPTNPSLTRVSQVFGSKPEDLETFEAHFEDISVRGWLDRNTRATNSRHLYFSVNGRPVRDKLLQQATLLGLRSRMMEGEYPKIYIEVTVAPEEVDMNVHPAKTEVRFRRSKDVFQVLHGALEKLARVPTQAFYSVQLPSARMDSDKPQDRPTGGTPPNDLPKGAWSDFSAAAPTGIPVDTVKNESYTQAALGFAHRTLFRAKENPSFLSERASASDTSVPFQTLHYIGQLKNTYLLFQDHDGLVLIDQHAAHERIRYEQVKSSFQKSGLTPQPLLLSVTVKATPEDVTNALDYAELFQKLGFEIEAFGTDCLILRSVPKDLDPKQSNELFRALLEELRDGHTDKLFAKDPARLSPKLERMLATTACHSSIRAGQALSPKEAEALVRQMEATDSSLNCPHGRPASIRLTFGQIEGLFKR